MNGDTVHGGIVRNSSTVSLYDTENALNNENMTNQRLGQAQERGQRTAHQQRNRTERGYRRCYNTKTRISTPWRNKPTSNVHHSQPSLRVGLNHEFRRRQGRAVGGVVAGQCRTVINALNRIERGIEDIYK